MMLTPSQIKMQTFTPVGRGAYRASDVDAFMQQIYVSFAELTSENASMKKKFASLSSIIDEYNAGKNAIATALVKAQAVADETVRTADSEAEATRSKAQQEANTLLEVTKQQAEDYAREKKETADAYFLKAQTELARVVHEAQEQSADFVKEVNAQAAAMIADANQKAAAIVAAAYQDAKTAKERTEEIIERANVEIETTRNAVAAFKEAALESLGHLMPIIDAMDPDSYGAGELALSSEIPSLEPQQTTAPEFNLVGVFEDEPAPDAEAPAEGEGEADTEVEAEAEAEIETEAEASTEAEPEEKGESAEELFAQLSKILHDESATAYTQDSLFTEQETAVTEPAFEEIVEPEDVQIPFDEDEAEIDASDDAKQPPLFTFQEPQEAEEIDIVDASDDVEEAAPTYEEAYAADVADEIEENFEGDMGEDDEAPLAFVNYDAADDDDDDGEQQTPFKFRLTKNFDIFDDDELDND